MREEARALAARPYVPKPNVAGDLTYDQYRSIRFMPERALWFGEDRPFLADFFHVGGLYKQRVGVHEIVDDAARPVAYDPAFFDFGPEAEAIQAVADPEFAGLRLHHPMDGLGFSEFAVFLGASYFRAVGRGQNYGLSARGLAIRSGLLAEEFPNFEAFWLERPEPGAATLTLHALLDGESAAGAYRFVLSPGETTVSEVSAWLYPRRRIDDLGLAPLTSMFMRGEADRGAFFDFRPQVHDSEGLSVRMGADDWLWRPLRNPDETRISRYRSAAMGGFGLVQRDRTFDNYLDLEARYDLRPGAWVEPLGEWGEGEVRLVELPTPEETRDNIVAFWTPDRAPEAGEELAFAYRLHWGPRPPIGPRLARVVGTYSGDGGIASRRDLTSRKFVIDFAGGRLGDLGVEARVDIEASADGSQILSATLLPNLPMNGWRVFLDVRTPSAAWPRVTCALTLDGAPLSERWTTA